MCEQTDDNQYVTYRLKCIHIITTTILAIITKMYVKSIIHVVDTRTMGHTHTEGESCSAFFFDCSFSIWFSRLLSLPLPFSRLQSTNTLSHFLLTTLIIFIMQLIVCLRFMILNERRKKQKTLKHVMMCEKTIVDNNVSIELKRQSITEVR